MTYKWEAIAQDLTEERDRLVIDNDLLNIERDRLLKENQNLRDLLEKFGILVEGFAQASRIALKAALKETS